MNKQLQSILNQLSKQYEKTGDETIIERVQSIFEQYLKENPHDNEVWITFAIFLTDEPTISYPEKAIECLQQTLAQDSQNVRALVILADIQALSFGNISNDVRDRLLTIETDDNEYMSMIEYAKARYCFPADSIMYEECLTRSVSYYSQHVNNNEKLGTIFINKGSVQEGYDLIGQALRSVTCIFPETYMYFDAKSLKITSVDGYIAEFITGTRTSYSRVKALGEYYVQCRSLLIIEGD